MIDVTAILESEKDLRKQVEDLSGTELPIDKESVVDRYVEVECSESLEKCETDEERKETKEKFVEHYISGPGKQFIDSCINQVNMMYQQVKSAVENVRDSVTSLSTSSFIPSVVTVGSASSTPNPAWTALDNKQKVKILLNILKQAAGYLTMLYSAALLIHLPLPPAVTAVGASISVVTALVNNIPV